MIALWILVVLACLAGGAQMFQVIGTAQGAISAPQQAAGMAIAVGLAVIPYCTVRAIQLAVDDPRLKELRAIRELLETHTRLLATIANATPSPETRTTSVEEHK